MHRNRVSRTAEFMAFFRALETCRREDERLFADPFATAFLSPGLRRVAEVCRVPWIHAVVCWIVDALSPGARPAGIARTRFIDDELRESLKTGVEQVVILGSGFDSRAYRLSGLEKVCVFEVDHPDTLAEKRRRFKQIGVEHHAVIHVAVDFERRQLRDALTDVGFDSRKRTFFLWEGVTNYLTREAVDAVLAFVRSTSAGSQILFTYVHRDVLDNPQGTRLLNRALRHFGEPWTFGLDPIQLGSYLEARGLRLVTDQGSLDYRTRYIGPSGRHLKGYEFYRAALASVLDAPPAVSAT